MIKIKCTAGALIAKALVFASVMFLVPTGLNAQQKTVKVQGHPHEYLTRKAAEGTAQKVAPAVTAPGDTYIDPADIECWIDEPSLNPYLEIDSAILMVKFTDGKNIDSVFVWGYRWNPYEVYTDPGTGKQDTAYIQHHGIDLLRAAANNDLDFLAMLQYSGVSGHSVGGLGMNWYQRGTGCYRVDPDFNIADAQKDPYIDFHYFDDPNCSDGQVATPLNPNNSVTFARIDDGRTGILIHPFGAEYGIPAYDFDYWNISGTLASQQHWQSGWVKNGYWAYYRAGNWRVPEVIHGGDDDPDYSQNGITYEPLENHQVQGFVFFPGVETSPYVYDYIVHDFNGRIIYRGCDCRPCETNKTKK